MTGDKCPECGRGKHAASVNANGEVTVSCRVGHKWRMPTPRAEPDLEAKPISMFGLKPHAEKEFEPLPQVDPDEGDQ